MKIASAVGEGLLLISRIVVCIAFVGSVVGLLILAAVIAGNAS